MSKKSKGVGGSRTKKTNEKTDREAMSESLKKENGKSNKVMRKERSECAEEEQNGLGKDELVAHIQRLQAEFDNYKKRIAREDEERKNYALKEFIKELLPVIDNIQIALKSHNNKKDSFYKGIELIYSQMMTLLKNHGVTTINSEGKFDPQYHEALMAEKRDDIDPNMILEVFQDGYIFNGRILRPAKVKISRR